MFAVLRSVPINRKSSHRWTRAVLLGDFVEAFQRLVIRTNAESSTPHITAEEALVARDHAANIELEPGPLALSIEGSTADEHIYEVGRIV